MPIATLFLERRLISITGYGINCDRNGAFFGRGGLNCGQHGMNCGRHGVNFGHKSNQKFMNNPSNTTSINDRIEDQSIQNHIQISMKRAIKESDVATISRLIEAGLTTKSIETAYGCSPRIARRWKAKIEKKDDLTIKKRGRSVNNF